MRAILLFGFLLFFASPSLSDDVVRVKGSTIAYRGEILRNDERGVTMKLAPRGELKEFAREQIERIDTRYPAAMDAGRTALSKGDFADAVPNLRSALREETRPWAQDQIKGLLLKALDGQGDVEGAADVFVELAPNRSDAGIMAYAPFRWVKEAAPADHRRAAARAWLLHNEEPVVRLLAANWLLETDAAQAKSALERLATDPDSRVRPIARAMLLRERLLKNAKSISKDDLAEFRSEVEKLPNAVRVGPQYVLALAYEANGDPIDAALAFLYVPFVTGGPPDVQADALDRASKACLKAGLKNDAAKLDAELRKRFPSAKRPASK